MANRGGNKSTKKMKTEDQGTSTVRDATWVRYWVFVWLISVIVVSSWVSLQLMTVFDVRSDLEKLPNITLKLNTVIDATQAASSGSGSEEKTSVSISSLLLARAISSENLDKEADNTIKTISDLQRELSSLKAEKTFTDLEIERKQNEYGKNASNDQKTELSSDKAKAEYMKGQIELTGYRIDQLYESDKRRNWLKNTMTYVNPAVQFYQSGLNFGKEWGVGFLLSPPKPFIGMPNMMLTLLVSLFMGALGSSIRMMVELVKTNETYNGRWYFFQPFLGALLAFAVFILFKSGHIALSGGGTGSGELNPFIIAFVAIVSGMLSEKAYRRIGVEGSRFLSEDAIPRRVLPSVALEQLRKLGQKPKDLEPFFKTPTDVINLLRGQDPLHPDNQRLVAAWLNVSEGDLLTDGKPTVMDRAVFDELNTATVEQRFVNRSSDEEEERGFDDDSDPETIRMLEWVAEDLAEEFPGEPGDLGDRLKQAAQSLGAAADSPDAEARKATVEQSHPMRVIAADVVERLQRAQQGLNLTLAPATLGCAIASMAAEMPDEMYRRWYAQVMDADPAVGAFGPDDYGQLTVPEGTSENGGIEAVMKDIDTLRAQDGDDGRAALDILVTTATYARRHGLDIDDLSNAFRALGGNGQ